MDEYHHIIYPRDFDCNDMKKLSKESKRKIRAQNHF